MQSARNTSRKTKLPRSRWRVMRTMLAKWLSADSRAAGGSRKRNANSSGSQPTSTWATTTPPRVPHTSSREQATPAAASDRVRTA